MIVPYNNECLESYVDLFLDVFTSEPFNYSWMHRDDMLRYFTDIQNSPRFVGLSAVDEGKLYGFCVGNISDYFNACSFEIKEIIVARSFQGKGRGSKMLAEIEKYLFKHFGVEVVTLLTDKNISAYPFYLKNGFDASETVVYMSKGIPEL